MFEGFGPGTIDFLWGIRFNNNRDWFQAHKAEYERELYRPMRDLAEAVGERFSLPNTIIKSSRIYRDVRYAPTPYKEWLWFVIREDREFWSEHPSLYFQIEPEGGSLGFIHYAPSAALMRTHRKRMLDRPGEFQEILDKALSGGRFTDRSTRYKRPKEGGTPEIDSLYQLKNCFLEERIPVGDELFRKDLPDYLADSFRQLTPVYEYFRMLEGLVES